MENLGVKQFGDVYSGKRVLVTGHTGFKGSWLTLWLELLGAKVVGISLSPDQRPNHWEILNLKIISYIHDIRDVDLLKEIFIKEQPEIVFHLAAQPLVKRSYLNPLETWSTNVLGIVNVLEACRLTSSVKSIVVVTSDKCYLNQEWEWGYRENDRLGGFDPYSASKAAAELVAESYRKSFFSHESNQLLATARAGNVIGGGDWSEDRLIPDVVRSILNNKSLEIRSPNSTRPWQHVLDSLSGYLMLGEKLYLGKDEFASAWNFGPTKDSNQNVSKILDTLTLYFKELKWHVSKSKLFHETNILYVDSAKSNTHLKWNSIWDLNKTLENTSIWYKEWMIHANVSSKQQIIRFIKDAIELNADWISN